METLEESAEEVAAPIAGKRHAQSVDGRPGGGGVLGHVQIGTHPCLITKHEGSVVAVWPRAPHLDSAAMWSPGARWSRWWSRQHTAHCLSLASRSPCESLGTLVMFRRTVHDMCPCGGRVVGPGALWSWCGRDRAPLSVPARRGDRHVRHWAHWLCPDGLWTTCARVVGVSSVQVLCGRGVVATGHRSVRPHGESVAM